jgi:aryl-alcohol dehydrogenase-like predicted oxidoreductase
MTVNSPNYSLCEQLDDPWGGGCITIGGKPGAQSREFYLKEDISIFSYSSLGRGMLSGRVTRENYKDLLDDVALKGYAYDINFDRVERARELAVKKGVTVAQIGLAFLLNQPLRVFPIVGAETEEELRSAAAALDIVLTKEECAWLDNGPDNK